MTFQEFKKSITALSKPPACSVYLQALWYDARGEWEKAHRIIQDIEDKKAAWIHAYLHRKEGDAWNADYWYRRAERNRPSGSLNEEWEYIVQELLPG